MSDGAEEMASVLALPESEGARFLQRRESWDDGQALYTPACRC